MVSWSAKHGDHPAGDPELNYYVGSLFEKGEHETIVEEIRKLKGLQRVHMILQSHIYSLQAQGTAPDYSQRLS